MTVVNCSTDCDCLCLTGLQCHLYGCSRLGGCALQNLTAGKVIIIHPYVYRLYWYLEAYNVTSAIAFCNTLVVEWIRNIVESTISRAAGFKSRHNWASKFLSCNSELQDVNSL